MTRSYSFLPCPDGPEPSITNPGQWWGGEDRRNKSWCPVQLNRLTLWSADDIYDSVNTVYVVLIDFSPCHRSIYMLGFCTIIQKNGFLPTSLHFLIIQSIHESDIQIQTVFRLIFFYTFFILIKKNVMCVHVMNIFFKMIISKKYFPYVKIQRKYDLLHSFLREFWILFFF